MMPTFNSPVPPITDLDAEFRKAGFNLPSREEMKENLVKLGVINQELGDEPPTTSEAGEMFTP